MRSLVFSDELGQLVGRHPDPTTAVVSEIQRLFADPARARFSAWYELFPRSASPDPRRPGTLADVERLLPYVARLGFDVLYLPPIHPIGKVNRKGRDGRPLAEPGDPGSPWAIGVGRGRPHRRPPRARDRGRPALARGRRRRAGHRRRARPRVPGSPDHPWVSEHPEWFRRDPDGEIRHAENPPKRYEDIYPLDFDSAELARPVGGAPRRGPVLDRSGHLGVPGRQPPHQAVPVLGDGSSTTLKAEHPELIFLSEAFTRPKVMYELARLGFTQSYTYFAWRNEKWEIESYFNELTRTEVADYFRPNLWPNTPDILTETLQSGRQSTFITRLVLAATLGASYGIYGPAFELQEHVAARAGLRGVPRLGEVRDSTLGPRPPRQPRRPDRSGERDPPGPPRARSTTGRCGSTGSTTSGCSSTRSGRSSRATPTRSWWWSTSTRCTPSRAGWSST